MNKIVIFIIAILLITSCTKQNGSLKLEVPSFEDGAMIPDQYAFCIPDTSGKFELGQNLNPHIRWTGIPPKTRSLALLFLDLDHPKDLRQVNVMTKKIPKNAERTEFYHWVLVDIPLSVSEIPEAADSKEVTKGGKSIGKTPFGIRGLNDYTTWFRGDVTMGGAYAGYDGPCSPWNDEKIHRYVLRLYALDVPTLSLGGRFTAEDALKAMEGHVIDRAEWRGNFTTATDLRQNPISLSSN